MRNVIHGSKRPLVVIERIVLVAFTVAGLTSAQQTAPDTPSGTVAGTTATAPAAADKGNIGPKSAQWKGLTVKEKLIYDGRHLFDVDNMVFAAVGAGFDQLRDRPGQWDQGAAGFGERYASHLGSYLVQRSVFFPVQAIDHEDTRYFRSERTSLQGRLGDAFLHTIWRHNDSGGMMPAYSEFLGDYGAAAVSRAWWPRQYHNGTAIFVAGSDTILVDAGINVFHEFKPDIKRWLHLAH
jgi:hypothetical protein